MDPDTANRLVGYCFLLFYVLLEKLMSLFWFPNISFRTPSAQAGIYSRVGLNDKFFLIDDGEWRFTK